MIWQSAEDLAERIRNEPRPPVFIVGSGLAAPLVPGTDEMVKLIRNELAAVNPASVLKLDKALEKGGNRYQVAFQHLQNVCGQNVVNTVIRRAVLLARSDHDVNAQVMAARNGDNAACDHLADDIDGWRITDGLAALGRIAARLARPKLWILTTNFDPLVDIAVRRADGKAVSIPVAADGNPLGAHQAAAVMIAHLHGHWYLTDSQHIPSVLSADRPQLRAALRTLMADRLIVVLGYAGWDDVLTRALGLLIPDTSAGYDLRWAFREPDSEVIKTRYEDLLTRLGPALDRRAHLHVGVDSNTFLPMLDQSLPTHVRAPSPPPTVRPAPGPLVAGRKPKVGRPRVYISYTWRSEGMKEAVFRLAEKLRAKGIDSRIDLYYAESRHGFLPPEKRADDDRPPWTIWQEEQIRDADRVLIVCSREYYASVEHPDEPNGRRSGAWHDVNFMKQDLISGRVEHNKFIPVGFGPYEQLSPCMPRFVKDANYYDLTAKRREGFGLEALIRRFRTEFPQTL